MQRIGRVDRRMDADIEKRIIADHPEQECIRSKIAFWNFLPPDELEVLLHLYKRVSHKTLRISKTFGIEGRKLLRPEDDYDALRVFNQDYDGSISSIEKLHLEFQKLLKNFPDLTDHLDAFPQQIFSGKKHPSKNARAVFFCYRIPHPDLSSPAEYQWTQDAGETKWFLYNLANDDIADDATKIAHIIRSDPQTPRSCTMEKKTLADIRRSVEKYIKNTILKRVQATQDIKPILKAWMELN